MINLTIDNKPVQVPEGTTILKAARMNGIDIPTLCHIDLKGTCVKNKPASTWNSDSVNTRELIVQRIDDY